MRKLQIISVNHRTHSQSQRVALNLSHEAWQELFAYMKYQLQVEGYVLLPTCNRVELYYEADRDVRFKIVRKWLELAGVEEQIQASTFRTYFGSSICMRYLLQLSVGLKSAVYGDDQILSQLKKAFEQSRSDSTMSTLLERSYQAVMRFHKQICKETPYRSQSVSLAYHGLKMIRNQVGKETLKSKSVLIIGAGDMAVQVLKNIDRFTFGSIAISNRTKSRAEQVTLGKDITVVPYESLQAENYDIVISCTDMGHDMVANHDSMSYYLDLSLMSANLGPMDCAHTYLSSLQSYINEQNESRLSCIGVVKRMLGEHCAEFSSWLFGWEERQREAISV